MKYLIVCLFILASCNNSKIHYIKGEDYKKRQRKVLKQNKQTRKIKNYGKNKCIFYPNLFNRD